jgi:hypothetical protein
MCRRFRWRQKTGLPPLIGGAIKQTTIRVCGQQHFTVTWQTIVTDANEAHEIFNLHSVFVTKHFHADKYCMSLCWALNISSRCRLVVCQGYKKWLTLICTRLLMASTSPISTYSKVRTIFLFPRPLTNFHGTWFDCVSGIHA